MRLSFCIYAENQCVHKLFTNLRCSGVYFFGFSLPTKWRAKKAQLVLWQFHTHSSGTSISSRAETNRSAMTFKREASDNFFCKHGVALCAAMTLERIMVLPSSHSPSVIKPSQAMRAALSERQLGWNSRDAISRSQPDDFPTGIIPYTRGVEDK